MYTFFFQSSPQGNKWTYQKDEKKTSYEDIQNEKALQSQKDTESSNNAIKSRDVELCKTIEDPTQKQSCLDNVMASLALDGKDPSKCTPLSSSGMVLRCQDNVYFSLAGEKNDKASCRSINDENIRTSCLESVEKSLFAAATVSGKVMSELCSTFETTIKTDCEHLVVTKDDTAIYRDAMSAKSLSSCDAISDEKLHSTCRDTLLYQKAVSGADASLCSQISDSAKAATCASNLNSRSDALKFQALVATGNLDDCDVISSDTLRVQCHDMVIIRIVRDTRDTSLCDMLTATGTIERCMKMVGK